MALLITTLGAFRWSACTKKTRAASLVFTALTASESWPQKPAQRDKWKLCFL
jgi:hypothetical protein